MKLLLEHGADVNHQTSKWESAPLICAAAIGHHSVVTTLLSNGADVAQFDCCGSTALIEAAAYDHAEIVSIQKLGQIVRPN